MPIECGILIQNLALDEPLTTGCLADQTRRLAELVGLVAADQVQRIQAAGQGVLELVEAQAHGFETRQIRVTRRRIRIRSAASRAKS